MVDLDQAADVLESGAVSSLVGPAGIDKAMTDFAARVGADGSVCVRGGGTRWSLGGDVAVGTREVTAPAGIVEFQPAEMTVRVRAATLVSDLHAELAAVGQRTALPERAGSTVGGALMAGESSLLRLGLGPARDALLQARYVTADGEVATCGAATVKNVSGFDLCRLLVGSLGTLGLVGEALLRTVPIRECEQWLRVRVGGGGVDCGDGVGGAGDTDGSAGVGRGAGLDPVAVRGAVKTAMSVLWDGADVWLCLGGHPDDVAADVAAIETLGSVSEVVGPPELPAHRWSLTPAEALEMVGSADSDAGETAEQSPRFVADVGVGTVHGSVPQPAREVSEGVLKLNRQFKARFDPVGRLNPGRDPLQR